MSTRERWIVYPLLFLTLGIALRDKMTKQIDSLYRIGGREMQIDLLNGAIRGRRIDSDLIRGQAVQAKLVRTDALSANGAQFQTLLVNEIQCGKLIVTGPDKKLSLVLGHFDEGKTSGLVAVDSEGHTVALVPLVRRPPDKNDTSDKTPESTEEKPSPENKTADE